MLGTRDIPDIFWDVRRAEWTRKGDSELLSCVKNEAGSSRG